MIGEMKKTKKHTPMAEFIVEKVQKYQNFNVRVLRKDWMPFIVLLNLEGRRKTSSTCWSRASSNRFSSGFSTSTMEVGVGGGVSDSIGLREYQDNGGLASILSMKCKKGEDNYVQYDGIDGVGKVRHCSKLRVYKGPDQRSALACSYRIIANQ